MVTLYLARFPQILIHKHNIYMFGIICLSSARITVSLGVEQTFVWILRRGLLNKTWFIIDFVPLRDALTLAARFAAWTDDRSVIISPRTSHIDGSMRRTASESGAMDSSLRGRFQDSWSLGWLCSMSVYALSSLTNVQALCNTDHDTTGYQLVPSRVRLEGRPM